MNPIVKIKATSKHVVYKLTSKDRRKLKKVRLIHGGGDKAEHELHQMCIMQAAAMVSVQAEHKGKLTDHPICVSPVITEYLIYVNDSGSTEQTRQELIKLVPDILNTCPIKATTEKRKGKVYNRQRRHITKEFREIEIERSRILSNAPSVSHYVPIEAKIKAVKEAAALYHTPDIGDDLEVVELG